MIKTFNYKQYDSELYHALIKMIEDDPENYTALIELGRLMFKLHKESEEV